MSHNRLPTLAAAVAATLPALAASPAAAQQQRAKNVIYLVADGAGQTVYDSTAFFNGERALVERDDSWNKSFMSVFPYRRDVNANNLGTPGFTGQDPTLLYSSDQAWNTAPTGLTGGSAFDADRTLEFEGYAYHDRSSPDSANTVSQSITGVKTYNNGVNVDPSGNALPTFTRDFARLTGAAVGIVTSVQVSDATPASFSGVNNQFRSQRTTITDQMLGKFTPPGAPNPNSNATSNGVPTDAPGGDGSVDYINVIMGTGNPDFDNNGNPRDPRYTWFSQETWNDLEDGDDSGVSERWQLIQDRADFEALADGSLDVSKQKLIGVVKSDDGKQQYRGDGLFGPAYRPDYTSLPGTNPDLRDDVPSLATMTQGALNLLTRDEDGFFIGIEQGEVDRSMHANRLGRTIEAQNDFNDAVALIDDLLTANAGDPDAPNYDNTLVIVTADHDHQLYGPESDDRPFDEIVDNGEGNLPGAVFQTGNHSNRLVPIFAKGVGADLILDFADEFDQFVVPDGLPRAGEVLGFGDYLDQSELYSVFLQATAIPEPAGLGLLAVGGLALARRRR